MSSSPADVINQLLGDKLFQVVGSTPTSVAESIIKTGLSGKAEEGVQMFAISVFAAAVNKSTLETYVADSRFASVRPAISAAMNIQGRSNMTAFTLLGHCLLTTSLAGRVSFTTEFRKKMGQNHLWDGELNGGSLSDKQREILKEKKRVTSYDDAVALGSGFLKFVKLSDEPFSEREANMFKVDVPRSGMKTTDSSKTLTRSAVGSVKHKVSDRAFAYATSRLNMTEEKIIDYIESNSAEAFEEKMNKYSREDPTGEKTLEKMRANKGSTMFGSPERKTG